MRHVAGRYKRVAKWRHRKPSDRAPYPSSLEPRLRRTHRPWLDAVGTPLTVQQKMMRHTDIRTTIGYGDVVTDEMLVAGEKVAQIASHSNGAQGSLTY
jgi:hypothetical protein